MKRLPNFSGLMCTLMLALGALAFMVVTPTAALAQTCGGSYTPSFVTSGPYFSGDTVTLKITMTSSVSGTTAGTEDVNEIDFITDCSNENGAYYDGTSSTCDGAGADNPVSFASVVSTTCKDAGLATVTWNEATNTPPTSGGIKFTPSAPVHFTGDAQSCEIVFSMTVNSTADPTNNPVTQSGRWLGTCTNSPHNLSGGAQGSDSFDISSCSVTLDKQVSCDGGTTWKDVTGADDTDHSLPPSGPECSGINAFGGNSATDIKVRYVITNTGTVALENCSANESNGLIIGATSGTVIIPGVNTGFNTTDATTQTTDPFTKACSAELAAGEADTATVQCDCAGTNGGTQVSDSDTADFACESPGLTVVKSCSPASNGVNNFTIDVSNTGALDLTNCNVTDAYQPNDTCTDTTLTGTTDVTSSLSPAGNGNYSISAGNSLPQFSGSISGLSADACNEASVTCTVAGTADTITATDQATCPVALGCDTRTPGFWGTHPAITQAVITDSGGSIESCGFGINSTVAADSCSATEDICSVGKDSNTLGIDPQDMQLVRQCMAAEINFAASVQDGGSCSDTLPGVAFTIEDCCGTAGVCATGGTPVHGATVAACISALDAFNNLETTIDGSKYLTSPGPADSSLCQISNGDGIVNNGPCGGGRVYSTKTTGNNAPNGLAKGKNK